MQISQNPVDPQWNYQLAANPSATIFHHPNWLSVIQQTYHYPSHIIRYNDVIIPFLEVRGLLGGKRWINLPFTDYYELLLKDLSICDEMGSFFNDIVNRDPIDSIELRWTFPSPYSINRTDNVLHLLNVDGNFSSMQKKISSSHRRNVNQASHHHLEYRIENDFSATKQFYKLHTLTRKKLGVPVQPWKFFQTIQTCLIDPGLGFYITIYQGSKYAASALFLKWQKTLTYKFGASDPKLLDLRPNNLLFWEAIQYACEGGFDCLDFGKTEYTNEGLRRFKSGWGANEIPLTYTYFTRKKSAENPRIGKKLEILGGIIKKSPTIICRLIGELLYPYFP